MNHTLTNRLRNGMPMSALCGALAAVVCGGPVNGDDRPASPMPGDGLTGPDRAVIYARLDDRDGALVDRHIIIVDQTRPNVFFGMYRASQMTQPGWDLYERSVDWANDFNDPATTAVWLATYNGTLDPDYPGELDGIAVYDRLINKMGFVEENIHVAHQNSIETANFDGYDIVLYCWIYPRDATNVMQQDIPFVTMSGGETDEMGIGTGIETMHEPRNYAYVIDNGHHITSTYDIGQITLEEPMWMDATSCSGNGRALVAADEMIPCPGDLNGDGVVNTEDLLLLLGDWGCNGESCIGDVDDDGDTDTADLLVLLAAWGECP